MTAYCKDETIYAEIEKAISNIRDLDLTQFDQNLRNQQLTDPPFNLSSSDLVRLLISVYVEYSSIENLGFNSVEEVKKVIEQSETIEQWEANNEKYSSI